MLAAPCCSMVYPLLQKFRPYFSINLLIKGFVSALLLWSPILLHHLELATPWLDTIILWSAFALLLGLDPKEAFWSGFFTGLLWFHWIALSLRYYDLLPLAPLLLLAIGLIYGGIFALGYKLATLLPGPWLALGGKMLFWLLVGSIHPFGFNWFLPDMLLAQSLIEPQKSSFALLLLSAGAIHLPRWGKLLLLAIAIPLLQPHSNPVQPPPLRIHLVTTKLSQDRKWDPTQRPKIIAENLAAITKAIEKGFDVVVLPESAFPLFLDQSPTLLQRLQELSSQITIVTGALHFKDGHYYNSTYLFHDGTFSIFDKVVLVPFGEAIPLPQPLARWINRLFFAGSSDYTPARKPATYTIKGIPFTNAICYEATHPLIYRTDPPFIIAISNNAWFTPSIEPTLQQMLIKYYATIFHKRVYHATNIAKTAVIY
ncbi:MAG: apolipoprotein N-acyltransferase [Epsilonproteobacteria bacterium]|nr:apolipoprotein N-acyltransferase [Campylobacterota bacterium]